MEISKRINILDKHLIQLEVEIERARSNGTIHTNHKSCYAISPLKLNWNALKYSFIDDLNKTKEVNKC